MFKQYFFKYTEDLSLLFLYKNLINGINESLFLEVLMMEIRLGDVSYSSYKKMVADNRGKVMLQEVEALDLDKFMDIDLLDEIRNTLEILQKKITRKQDKIPCSSDR